MDAKAGIIRSLVFSASSRFSACETQQDFEAQQRLYGELLTERIDELLAAERERCAAIADHAAGGFEVARVAAAIRALD